jgi:hypothetical protein
MYAHHHHHHHHIGCRNLGLVTCSDPTNILEGFEGLFLASFPTWLIFHNCVHSPNMLYLFISVILNLLHNWVILSSDKLSLLVLQFCHMYFSVLINFISPNVILDLLFSLIAHNSQTYSKIGNAKALYIISLVWFWF